MRFVLALLCLGFVLACSGMDEVTQVGQPCCSVQDVIDMTVSGVESETIIDAIYTSGTDLELTAGDISGMSEAGVDPVVIDTLNGGPCICEAPEVVPEPAARPRPRPAPKPAAVGLRLAVKYNGGKSFELVNLSTTTYTGITVLVNNEYQYRLKKLPANKGDFIRLSSFVSRRTGAEAKRVKMTSIHVTAEQGTYSRSF